MHLFRIGLTVLGLVCASGDALLGQTVMAFNTGEETTGMTKQCFYNALGNAYTRTVRSIDLCPLSIQVPSVPRQNQSTPTAPQPPRPMTVMAFKTGERTTGMTKQCFYEALGSAYTRTMSSTALCPLSIQVKPGGSS